MSKSKITKRVVGAGAAVALGAGIGLATAAPANADTWDKVAQCESGGNWSTNTGNGFSGGLQFTKSTWNANGGKGSPQGASKAQQKNVARSVLKSQGAGAWPECGPKAGLSKSNGGAKTNAGSGNQAQSASNHTKSSHNTRSNNSSNHNWKSHQRSSNNNSSNHNWKSHQQSSNNSSNHNWKSHQQSSNNSSNHNWKSHQQNSNNNGSKSYSSHQQSAHKSYTPKHSSGNTTKQTTNYTPKRAAQGNGHTVTVKSGDTLGSIAAKHGISWKKLYNANKGKVSNPNVIYAGQTLQLG